jgi:hypothetical protein
VNLGGPRPHARHGTKSCDTLVAFADLFQLLDQSQQENIDCVCVRVQSYVKGDAFDALLGDGFSSNSSHAP